MRTRLTRLATAAVAAVVAALVLAPAAPAKAGGPTSVLLSVPGADSITSLYYLDAEYDDLSALMGVDQPSGTFAPDASGPASEGGAGINVTWLIHDVSPWRVDRIVLAKGGPWISTTLMDDRGRLDWTSAVWHRPGDPAGLVALLRKLGLDLAAAAQPGFEGVGGAVPVPSSEHADEPAAVDSDVEGAAAPTPVTDPAEDDAASTPGWVWATVGLALGVLIGAAFVLAWSRRGRDAQAPEEEPDGVPVDVPVEVLVR